MCFFVLSLVTIATYVAQTSFQYFIVRIQSKAGHCVLVHCISALRFHFFHQIGKLFQYFMGGRWTVCNVPKTLKFSWKACELSLCDLMVLYLALLCDLEIHLARVSSMRSSDCCLSRSSFLKPSPPSLLSPTLSKRFKCSSVFTYSIILLKYALLKTCTKPHEGPIAHENQFLILHCLKLSHSPKGTDRELMGVLFLSS